MKFFQIITSIIFSIASVATFANFTTFANAAPIATTMLTATTLSTTPSAPSIPVDRDYHYSPVFWPSFTKQHFALPFEIVRCSIVPSNKWSSVQDNWLTNFYNNNAQEFGEELAMKLYQNFESVFGQSISVGCLLKRMYDVISP